MCLLHVFAPMDDYWLQVCCF